MPKNLLKMLKKRLHITNLDLVEAGGRYLSFKHLLQFPNLGHKSLVNAPLPAIKHPQLKKSVLFLMLLRRKIYFYIIHIIVLMLSVKLCAKPLLIRM